jgi:hypothetical protein
LYPYHSDIAYGANPSGLSGLFWLIGT